MPDLPCPRFELRWEPMENDETYNWMCTYSLVFPLDPFDIRCTDVEGNPRELFLKICTTKAHMLGRTPVVNGRVDMPFRDGVHARRDCAELGGHIPIVAICGDVVTFILDKPLWSDLVDKLREAAKTVIANACDSGSFGPTDLPEEDLDGNDYPRDEDGDPWYSDLFELNECLDALDAMDSFLAGKRDIQE